MKRLTEKQRDAFMVVFNKPDGSLRSWGDKLGISHMTFQDRLIHVEKKGYVEKEGGAWRIKAEGVEKIMNDGIHNRFIRSKK